jgi:hypothetical protein
MTDSQHEPTEDATLDRPDLDLLSLDDAEGLVKLFEPDANGAYMVVDEFTLVPLDECA